VHRKYIPIYIQQDATLHILFISGTCSTCFGWYLHPSSGAHTNVSTTSGICRTVIAVAVAVTVRQIPDVVDTVVCAPDDGWRYHPKHAEQVPDINKLCKVASCWIYIGIYFSIPIIHANPSGIWNVPHADSRSYKEADHFRPINILQ